MPRARSLVASSCSPCAEAGWAAKTRRLPTSCSQSCRASFPGCLTDSSDSTPEDASPSPRPRQDAIVALADLVSPTSAFVRERCEVGPASEVPCDELYAAWKSWAEDNGHRVGSSSSFGRDLRAVLPSVRTVRPRDDDRQRLYRGLRLSGDRNGPVHGPSWTRPPSEPVSPAAEPAVQDGPRDQPLWVAGDEPAATVHCDHYHAHQSIHRWAGDRWVCPACSSDDDGGEPGSTQGGVLRESPDLGDWSEAPLPGPDEAATDEWGTLG